MDLLKFPGHLEYQVEFMYIVITHTEQSHMNFTTFFPVQVVSTKKGAGHVLVTSAEEMRSVALYRCDKATTCGECVALQDPVM